MKNDIHLQIKIVVALLTAAGLFMWSMIELAIKIDLW